jgi:hypothetical protein
LRGCADSSRTSTRRGFPSYVGGVLEGTYLDRARQARETDNLPDEADEQRTCDKARRSAYEAWCRQRAQERIAALSDAERDRLIEASSATIRRPAVLVGRASPRLGRLEDFDQLRQEG